MLTSVPTVPFCGDRRISPATDEVQAEREKQAKKAKTKRWLAVGLGTVVGGVVIGVTGGLAAPLVAAGAGAVFGGGAATAFATTAGIYTIGALFAAGGGGLVAHKTNKRFGKLSEFQFIDLNTVKSKQRKVSLPGGGTHRLPGSRSAQPKAKTDEAGPQQQENLHVVINVNGWIPTRYVGAHAYYLICVGLFASWFGFKTDVTYSKLLSSAAVWSFLFAMLLLRSMHRRAAEMWTATR